MREFYNEYAYTRMPWGKFKGFYLKDIPEEYLTWAASSWNDRGVALMFKVELERRSLPKNSKQKKNTSGKYRKS